jgi:hypothetical protein
LVFTALKLAGSQDLLAVSTEPRVNFLADYILFVAVAFLDLSFEMLALPIDLHQIIVGELASLFPYFTRELLPISSNSIPIHLYFLHFSAGTHHHPGA